MVLIVTVTSRGSCDVTSHLCRPPIDWDVVDGVVVVLLHHALSPPHIPLQGLPLPPVLQVPVLVELPALVCKQSVSQAGAQSPEFTIKSVSDLVPDDPADGSVVEVVRSLAAEENSLQDPGRKLN